MEICIIWLQYGITEINAVIGLEQLKKKTFLKSND